jgi:hypothetical protein
LWSEIADTLLDHFRAGSGVAGHVAALEEQVAAGTRSPTAAASELLASFFHHNTVHAAPLPSGCRSAGLTKRGSKS